MNMKITSPSGPLPFNLLTFPDGQQHLELLTSHRDGAVTATIEARIANTADLFNILLAKDALDATGYIVSLDIRYLLGARMDRRINMQQPFTLAIVARILRQAGFSRIRILDPHSPVACSLTGGVPILPHRQVSQVLEQYDPATCVVVIPDIGAVKRVHDLLDYPDHVFRLIQGHKVRESTTGKLTGFSVEDGSAVNGKTCLILDDICDGGGTFTGLAEVLDGYGARHVDLFVTHGIFSKGTHLAGIRRAYTTDSYFDWQGWRTHSRPDSVLIPLPIDLGKEYPV